MTNNIIIILVDMENAGNRMDGMHDSVFHGLTIILHFIQYFFFHGIVVSQPAGTNIISNVNLRKL